LSLSLGVKSDPIEYRYSFPWLFDLMAEAGVDYLQLGTFTELYSLAPEWFQRLAEVAEKRGIKIKSFFSSHREMGGWMTGDPDLEAVAVANFRHLVEVAAAAGADYAGCNLGRAYADRPEEKAAGFSRALSHLEELSHFAAEKGLKALTIEPMSCLAEPPTLPEECQAVAERTSLYHTSHPEAVPIYFCGDISHGYANAAGKIVHDNWELFTLQIPRMCEFHFKNTDAIFNSTFGFSPSERAKGVVELGRLSRLLASKTGNFPVEAVVGYLEIGGPKHGRDYSDPGLGTALRESLSALQSGIAFSD
jgi:ribulose-phosphate 3-epimerase